jgi:hypothetical protein
MITRMSSTRLARGWELFFVACMSHFQRDPGIFGRAIRLIYTGLV